MYLHSSTLSPGLSQRRATGWEAELERLNQGYSEPVSAFALPPSFMKTPSPYPGFADPHERGRETSSRLAPKVVGCCQRLQGLSWDSCILRSRLGLPGLSSPKGLQRQKSAASGLADGLGLGQTLDELGFLLWQHLLLATSKVALCKVPTTTTTDGPSSGESPTLTGAAPQPFKQGLSWGCCQGQCLRPSVPPQSHSPSPCFRLQLQSIAGVHPGFLKHPAQHWI